MRKNPIDFGKTLKLNKVPMLTSHELGFYRSFACYEKPRIKNKPNTKKVVGERDYIYLYLKKIAINDEVSITQKELAEKLGVTVQTIRRGQQRLEKCGLLKKIKMADPTLGQPLVFKVLRES